MLKFRLVIRTFQAQKYMNIIDITNNMGLDSYIIIAIICEDVDVIV